MITTDAGARKRMKSGECDVKLKITTYLMQLNIFDIDANKMLMNNFRNKGVENSFFDTIRTFWWFFSCPQTFNLDF